MMMMVACSALHSSHLSQDPEEDDVDYNSWAGVHDFNQGEGEDGLMITDLDISRSITVMMTTVKMMITLTMMMADENNDDDGDNDDEDDVESDGVETCLLGCSKSSRRYVSPLLHFLSSF